MLVEVNKAKFSPWETWGAPYIRLSLHHEKYLHHSLVSCFLSPSSSLTNLESSTSSFATPWQRLPIAMNIAYAL